MNKIEHTISKTRFFTCNHSLSDNKTELIIIGINYH